MQQHSVGSQVARISVRALRGLPENALQRLMGISHICLAGEDLILSEERIGDVLPERRRLAGKQQCVCIMAAEMHQTLKYREGK